MKINLQKFIITEDILTRNRRVNFINQNGKQVGSNAINGNVDDTGYVLSKVTAPSGYSINNVGNPTYTIKTTPQTINLNVTGQNASDIKNNMGKADVTIVEKSNGDVINQFNKLITVNGKVGDTYTINPKDYDPDSSEFTSVSQPLSGVINVNGLSNRTATFTYNANDASPITLEYKDQAGNIIGGKHDINGSFGQHINDITSSADGGVNIPNGYILNSGAKVDYTFGATQQNIVLNITGRKPKDLPNFNANNFIANIHIIKENDNGQQIATSDQTRNFSNTEIGNSYTINAPSEGGYNLVGNSIAKGTITSNGITNNNITFTYKADPTQIDPIEITYLNQNGHYINSLTGSDLGTDKNSNVAKNDTYTITSTQLANLGGVGSTVDLVKAGYIRAPHGYQFSNHVTDSKGTPLDAFTIQRIVHEAEIGMIKPVMLTMQVPTPTPSHHDTNPAIVPNNPTIPESNNNNSKNASAIASANTSASNSARVASASASASASNAIKSAENSANNRINNDIINDNNNKTSVANEINNITRSASASVASARNSIASTSASISNSINNEINSIANNNSISSSQVRDASTINSANTSVANAEKSVANVSASASNTIKSVEENEANQNSANDNSIKNLDNDITTLDSQNASLANSKKEIPTKSSNIVPSSNKSHASATSNNVANDSSTEVGARNFPSNTPFTLGSSNNSGSSDIGTSTTNSNNGNELPQTDEQNDGYVLLSAIASLLFSLGLAGVDLDYHYNR